MTLCHRILFVLLAVTVFASELPAAEPVRVERTAVRGPWKTRISVRWSGAPLRESLDRLAESYSLCFLLDRRIDPSLKLVFEAKNEPLELALPRLAAEHGLGCRLLSATVYIGPEESAAILPELLDRLRKRTATLPSEPKKTLRDNVRLTAPMLVTPKEILAELNGTTWRNLDVLPHDLWDETRLLGTVEELLTVVLIGFKMTFEPDKDGLAVVPLPEITPSTEPVERPTVTKTTERTQSEKVPLARRRFTLRVEEQKLNELLQGLAGRLERTLKLDEKSLEKKGVAPDRRVSFEVKNATAAELFRAILDPLDLRFRIRDDSIEVF